MGAAKILSEIFGPAFTEQVNGNARSIGGDQGARLAELLQFFVQTLFNIQSLHHHFNCPVAGGNVFQVVIKIAGSDPLHRIFGING